MAHVFLLLKLVLIPTLTPTKETHKKKEKMGSSTSAPPKQFILPPQEIETTVLTWLNHYYGEFVKRNKKLPIRKNCPLGKIEDIKLCDIVNFPLLNCLQVRMDSLRGLEDLKFVQFKIFRKQDTLHVLLGVIFGIPQATLYLTRLKNCPSTSKILTYPLPETCSKTEIAVGSEKNHAAIHMEIVFPEFASPKVVVQTTLGEVKMECLEDSRLFNAIRYTLFNTLENKINAALTAQMQNFLTNAWKNLTT